MEVFDVLLEAFIGMLIYGVLVYTVIYFALKPIKARWPDKDYRLVWVAPLVLGAIVAIATDYNAFHVLLPDDIQGTKMLGILFTGICIGGLATIIHDTLTKNKIDFGEYIGDVIIKHKSEE